MPKDLGYSAFVALAITAGLVLATACQTQTEELTPDSEPTTRSQEEELRALAESLDITDPPEVEVVREVSPAESGEVHSACMVEAGWVQNDDLSFSVPDDQRAAFNLARYRCTAAYPIAERYLQPMDTEQWAMVYDHYVEEFVPCAERHGFEVSEPPTRERFLAAPKSSWSPVADIERDLADAIGEGQFASFADFYELCPSHPTEAELWGEPES